MVPSASRTAEYTSGHIMRNDGWTDRQEPKMKDFIRNMVGLLRSSMQRGEMGAVTLKEDHFGGKIDKNIGGE